ncbi:RNA polymerase sigma factor [Subsaxibacter sp. CAU 1640]|uniref:RNA polymerase sigma factor n=1 Tax=Subsaxibacter sp. CAU 1640 TaxID=2933271 RepID=UPI002003EE6F|nr:RNA polymerase sigma factor [Subsaxibacter sp. CAU 1640]MCK7589573.1 RNA polymerase sigma factor [Subsaxibacter sp. CAU 1640]
MSLEQLIEQCKKNDAKAQSQIYKLYASKLFSLSLKYSRNYAEAQDNLQDAFVTIFKKIEQYKSKGSLEGWMKRITINTALQQYRSVGVFDIIGEEQIEDVSVEIDNDNIGVDYLLKIIQELPDRYRLVFNLYALDDYSHQEIADMLEISIGTSKSNLARARLILKEKIEHYKASSNSQSL